MRTFFIRLLLSAVLLLYGTDGYGAAWTQSKGNKQVIFTNGMYQSSNYFDGSGRSRKSSTRFTKTELNPFIEYGLTDSLTIGLNPSIQQWEFEKNDPADAVYDFRQCGMSSQVQSSRVTAYMADMELFARKRFYEKNSLTFAGQALVKSPCLVGTQSGSMELINGTMDAELRVLGGYGFKWDPKINWGPVKRPFAGQYHFVDVEAAYRKRGNQFSDQLRFDATAGFRYNKNLLLMTQVYTTVSVSDEPVRGFAGNSGIATERDSFYSVKAQFAAVQQITKKTSLQLSVYKDVMGKNSGNGAGVSASLWYSF